MIIAGKDNVKLFRMKMLLIGLRTEINTGMKLTRGKSAYSIIKSEYGITGNKKAVYYMFTAIYNEELKRVQA
jgi:hypothetical protein